MSRGQWGPLDAPGGALFRLDASGLLGVFNCMLKVLVEEGDGGHMTPAGTRVVATEKEIKFHPNAAVIFRSRIELDHVAPTPVAPGLAHVGRIRACVHHVTANLASMATPPS